MFTLFKNIPKMFYYTPALAKPENNQVESKAKWIIFLHVHVRADRGPDVTVIKTSRKCNT